MSRSIFFLAMLLLMSTGRMMGQNVSDLPANSYPFNLTGQTIMKFDERYKDVNGYHTYAEKFVKGTVRLRTGQVHKNVLINYDCVNDDLISQSNAMSGAMLVRKDLVESFTMSLPGQSGEVHFIQQTISESPTFLWVLVADTIPLFCKVKKVIKGGDFTGAYNTNEYKAREFVTEYVFYISMSKNQFIEVPNKRKSFVKLFPQYQQQLEEYFQSSKVNFNDTNDVRLLMLFVNDLVKSK